VVGTPSQGFRFHRLDSFSAGDYVRGAFSDTETRRLMRQSACRFRGEHERLALVGAHCRLLMDQGLTDRARATFVDAIREGGFADNYALDDLLAVAHDWAVPLRRNLLESVLRPTENPSATETLRAVGPHAIAIPSGTEARPNVAEFAAVETGAASHLALNFWASRWAKFPLRICVQVFDPDSRAAFFEDEYLMEARKYQPVNVPLNGRLQFTMRWTASGEGAPEPANEVHCIAPMLIT
jgi:hypothetical protein